MGDEALRRIGQELGGCVRSHDVVGRVGGDEFALVFSETGAADAETSVERSRARLRPLCIEFDIDVSVGVVTFQEAPGDLDSALQRADELMYEAKAAGRGSVRFGSEARRRAPAGPTDEAGAEARVSDNRRVPTD